MKYKTFRRGVIVLSVLVGGAGLWGVVRAVNGAHEAQPVVPIVAPTPGPAGSSPADTTEHSTAAPLEPYERLLKGRLGQPASSDKIKDALGGGAPKVNIYAEKGVWARAKVDFDRDEHWDQKWWVVDGQIWRAISPDDDEKYQDKELVGSAGSP